MLRVSYLPVLQTLRELYLQPRDIARFRSYIATLTGGTDDVVLPLGVANPMAKEHAVAKIDELLALGADDIGAEATRSAEERLASITLDVEIKATVVLADDVAGGWTNRYTTEASVRFPSRGALKRPFASALVWTSESPNAAEIRAEVLAAIYRVAYQQRHGLPTTLAATLQQEGLAAMFATGEAYHTGRHGNRHADREKRHVAGEMRHADVTKLALSATEVERARGIIDGLGDDPPYPQVFAALYGDAAAEQLGYTPLGLPPRAGFQVALADALERGADPLAALA